MSVQVFGKESSVFFACGGIAKAGGCTLQYILDNDGFADFDKSKIMDEEGHPIALANGNATYYNASGIILAADEFTNVEVGMILHIDTIDNPGRYEIKGTDGIGWVAIESGLDTGDVGSCTVSVGGSFDTISNALDEITADDASGKYDCYLFINKSEVVTARPQVQAGGGGDIHLNSRLLIIGFNTTLKDMFPGGAYYQSPVDAWYEGIDASRHIKIDLDDINSFLFSDSSVVVQNLRITNHTDDYAVQFAASVRGIVFRNCIIDDSRIGAYFGGTNSMICFIECYFFGMVNELLNGGTANNYFSLINCVLHSVSGTGWLIRVAASGIVHVSGSLIITETFLFQNSGSYVEWNNTIISASNAIHFLQNAASLHVGFNDIIVMPQDGKFIQMGDQGGCALLLDSNCLWGDDDQPFTGTYCVNAETGGQVSIRDLNVIDIDPELDAKYRPGNSQVIRGGAKNLSDVKRTLGAVLTNPSPGGFRKGM